MNHAKKSKKYKLETPFWRMTRGHFVMFRFYTMTYKISLSIDNKFYRWFKCSDELILTLAFIRIHYLRGNHGKVY